MKYVDQTNLTGPVGGMVDYEWYCNGVFKPDVTFAGHQPMGYNQMMTYYNFCVILGSRITATFMVDAVATAVPVMCGIQIYDIYSASLGVPGNFPYTDWTTVRESGQMCKVLSTNKPSCTIQSFFSHKKLTGQTPAEISQTSNTSTVNALRKWGWRVWIQSADKATTSPKIQVNIKIDYIAKFFDHRLLPPSS